MRPTEFRLGAFYFVITMVLKLINVVTKMAEWGKKSTENCSLCITVSVLCAFLCVFADAAETAALWPLRAADGNACAVGVFPAPVGA